jgi:hypothetical protein
MRRQLAILISVTFSAVTASAQQQTPEQHDSGAPTTSQSPAIDRPSAPTLPEAKRPRPETHGQAANFEDRWSAQREIPDRLPEAMMPDVNPSNIDQAAKPPLDQGNENWDPPPIAAPTTQR